MKRGLRVCIAGVVLVVSPAASLIARDTDQKAESSLHDLIAEANSRTPPADPKAELSAIELIRAQAADRKALASEDGLILDKLYAVARAHNGDYSEAATILIDVVARARAAGLGNDPLMSDLLENLGTMESLKGDPVNGLEHLLEAAKVMRSAARPDLDELAAIEGSIGYTYFKMGRVVDAATHYRQAIEGREPVPQSQSAYLSNVNNLVNAYSRLGDFEEALRYSKFGIEKAGLYLPADHVGFAYFYTNAASTYLELGRLEEAEALYRRALAVLDAHPDANRSLRGVIVGKLSDVLRDRGMIDEARLLAQQSAAIVKDAKSSDQDTVGLSWLRLARLSMDKGDSATAAKEAMRALEELRIHGDTTGTAWKVNELLARVRLFDGDLAGALEAIDLAAAGVGSQLPEEAPGRVGVGMLRALILARIGRGEEAWQAAEPLGELMARRMSDGHVSQRGRSATAKVYRQNLARLADIAFTAGRPEAAFRAAQLASFSEISASSLALAARAAGGNGEAARLSRSVQDLQERSDRLQSERNFAMGKSANYVAEIDARIQATDRELEAQLALLERTFPAYVVLTRPSPATIADAQQGLRPGQALLLPVQSDDHMLSLALTRNGLEISATRLLQPEAARAIGSLRKSLDGDSLAPFERDAAWLLGGAILSRKIVSHLDGIDEVHVVGSGPIMTLPLGLLLMEPPRPELDPADLRGLPFAIRRFAFAVKPTVDVHAVVERSGRSAFLGVGAPALGPSDDILRGGTTGIDFRGGIADGASLRDLPSLPRAKGELAEISRALPQKSNVLLTGLAATEAAVRAQPLARFGVLAFATHGLINGEMRGVNEPALVLTPPAGTAKTADNDGLLTASEIAGLKLKARWVILSACNTGAGSENGAGGYSGLARGFMQAGAQNLLVSLWPVRDDIAARLTIQTVHFHASGMSEPAAMRRAMLALIDDAKVREGANPALWAPFSLIVQ